MEALKHRPLIGVMGSSACNETEYSLAERVGELIAHRGGILLCGGGTGVMEAVAKGAKKANGITIGILPGSNMEESPPNHFIDIPIFTGMSDGRNAINAKTADIIIAIGGEGGTLSEIGLALKNNKEVVALQSWELKRKDKIPSQYHTVGSPEEAVELAFSLVARHKL